MGREQDILSCSRYINKVTLNYRYSEDFSQNAWLEVIKLYNRYNGNVKFFTLAKPRITGSVIDYIRKETHKGKLKYTKLDNKFSYNVNFNKDLDILLKNTILNKQEQLWLKLYLKDYNWKEISTRMGGICESRISIIKTSVIKKLKEKYENSSVINSTKFAAI